MSLPTSPVNALPILEETHADQAVDLLRRYFHGTRGTYTGASFEVLGHRWDAPETVDVLTAADLLAVSTLSVNVPASASIALLGAQAAEVSDLLSSIPADAQLVDARDGDLGQRAGGPSPLLALWRLLREHAGIGPTTASKILARKRPLLVPIYDTVVGQVLGLEDSRNQWATTREMIRDQDARLQAHLVDLRTRASLAEVVSPLRVLDVVLWMYGKDERSARSAEL